jgi:hypothetical protein
VQVARLLSLLDGSGHRSSPPPSNERSSATHSAPEPSPTSSKRACGATDVLSKSGEHGSEGPQRYSIQYLNESVNLMSPTPEAVIASGR